MAQNGQNTKFGAFWSPLGSTSIGSGDESHTLYVLSPLYLLLKTFMGFRSDYNGRKLIFFIFQPFSYIFSVKIHTFLTPGGEGFKNLPHQKNQLGCVQYVVWPSYT